jgi:hypothetical protein
MVPTLRRPQRTTLRLRRASRPAGPICNVDCCSPAHGDSNYARGTLSTAAGATLPRSPARSAQHPEPPARCDGSPVGSPCLTGCTWQRAATAPNVATRRPFGAVPGHYPARHVLLARVGLEHGHVRPVPEHTPHAVLRRRRVRCNTARRVATAHRLACSAQSCRRIRSCTASDSSTWHRAASHLGRSLRRPIPLRPTRR